MYQRILHDTLRFPDDMSPDAQSIIAGLLQRDPTKRLGVNGAEEIKKHPFFAKHIDWNKCVCLNSGKFHSNIIFTAYLLLSGYSPKRSNRHLSLVLKGLSTSATLTPSSRPRQHWTASSLTQTFRRRSKTSSGVSRITRRTSISEETSSISGASRHKLPYPCSYSFHSYPSTIFPSRRHVTDPQKPSDRVDHIHSFSSSYPSPWTFFLLIRINVRSDTDDVCSHSIKGTGSIPSYRSLVLQRSIN